MKYMIIFLSIIMQSIMVCGANQSDSISLVVSDAVVTKMPLLIYVVSKTDGTMLRSFAQNMRRLVAQEGWKKAGFAVNLQERDTLPSKNQIGQLAKQYDLILFLSANADGMIEWRLYDARQVAMIKGAKSIIDTANMVNKAERLADDVYKILLDRAPFFSTRIAFCRKKKGETGARKQLCVVPAYVTYRDPEWASRCAVLIEGNTIFAPRWNNDLYMPLVFYSQTMDSYVRLIAINMARQRRLISNMPGMNFQPTFSHTGKKVIYCALHNGKTQLCLYTAGEGNESGRTMPFLSSEGNCVSPQLCANDDVIFCSDRGSRVPRICWYHALSGDVENITNGYSVCPAYHEKNKLLVYCKRVKGYMQLFVYNTHTKTHEQLTSDATNKEECSWSPCGTYIAYSADEGTTSRIALFNRITKEQKYLTGQHEQCTYPVWSPAYHIPLSL